MIERAAFAAYATLPERRISVAEMLPMLLTVLKHLIDHRGQRFIMLTNNRDVIAGKREGDNATGEQRSPSEILVQYPHTVVEVHEVCAEDDPTTVQRLRVIVLLYVPVQPCKQAPWQRRTFVIERCGRLAW